MLRNNYLSVIHLHTGMQFQQIQFQSTLRHSRSLFLKYVIIQCFCHYEILCVISTLPSSCYGYTDQCFWYSLLKNNSERSLLKNYCKCLPRRSEIIRDFCLVFTEAVITKKRKNIVPRGRMITCIFQNQRNLKILQILETSSYLENAMACKLITSPQALLLLLPQFNFLWPWQ